MPFNFTNNKDRAFFEKIVGESIEIFGISIVYYITIFDATKDKIYQEDTRPKIGDYYYFKAYLNEIIAEDWILSRFGFNSEDFLQLYIAEKDFANKTSTIPKMGDFVTIDYMNNRLFVVTDVDKEDNVFLQKKYVYKLQLKPADVTGEEITNDKLPNYETIVDNMNDNSAITEAASAIVVEKTNDKKIFGDWD
mgnify:CR=1 FL=1